MVAYDFVHRERHLLLHLVLHQLLELIGRNGGELGETGEHHLPVERKSERPWLDSGRLRKPTKSGHKHSLGRTFSLPVKPDKLCRAVCRKGKPLLPLHGILGKHRTGGAYVQCYDSGHKLACVCFRLLMHHLVVVRVDESKNGL